MATDLEAAAFSETDFEPLFQALWSHDSIGLALADTQGLILRANQTYSQFLGYDPSQLVGHPLAEFIHPQDVALHHHQFQTLVAGPQTRYSLDQRYIRKDSTMAWGRLTASLIDHGGKVSPTVLLVYENLTLAKTLEQTCAQTQAELQALQRALEVMAQDHEHLSHNILHDGLTGLPNRDRLTRALKTAIKQSQRHNSPRHALLFLDLDNFKAINDSLGHWVGDQVLIAMAAKLKSLVRETDSVARLGGDEFIILLEDDEPMKGAIRSANRLFADLQAPVALGDRNVFLSISIGIVLVTPTYSQAADLLRDADIAMYRAKNKGKSRYEVFDADMHAQALQRLHLENDLHQALANQELVVHYQPIISLKTLKIEGFEALVRWQHPQRGLVGPVEFVPVAEDIGLIIAIDRWVLRTVCRQLAAWHQSLPTMNKLRASVNLSVQDLWNTHLIDDIDDILAQTGLAGHYLTLEITESMMVTNMATTTALIHQLRQRGIHISIDDFGTGYSSLSYLHQLPADALKIDCSFVSQMLQSPKNHKIVQTILTLSHQLGLSVIAEGIETVAQREALAEMGCNCGQGNWFSPPLPAAKVVEYLGQD